MENISKKTVAYSSAIQFWETFAVQNSWINFMYGIQKKALFKLALKKFYWMTYTEKTFLPKWLEITSSSIFPAIWAGLSYWNSRKTVIPAIRAQKSCPNSRKNWAGSNFKPFWQECFFRVWSILSFPKNAFNLQTQKNNRKS